MEVAAIRVERLRERLNPLRQALLAHPIYQEIDSLGALRLFMEHHVFAVWERHARHDPTCERTRAAVLGSTASMLSAWTSTRPS